MRLLLLALLLAPPTAGEERDRSPVDLALSEDGRWALTANAGSDSVSLVDLEGGKVAAEVPAGKQPFAVAWRGARAVVTNRLSDSVTVLDVAPPRLAAAAPIVVGDEPRGAALAKDGSRAFVALAGEDAVAVLDLAQKKVAARIAAGDEPWHLALTPDGKRLAVGNALSQDVSVVDVAAGRVLYSVPMRGPNLRHVAMSPDGAWAYVTNVAERGRSATKENIDRGWVIASRLSRVPLREEGWREAISLDPRSKAVGDVDGVAVSPDGQSLAVTAGGTHEILLLRLPLPFVAFGGPGDHIDGTLLRDARRFRRVDLGGRPLGVAFTPDGKRVVVANAFLNAVQVVDFESGKLLSTAALGGPAEASLARKGEAIFTDARRSFNQWFSCHTCHVEGHTNGSSYDTLNDGKYGNLKKTLSLRGVTRTGPWTWHGWQADLREAVRGSMTQSMQGPEPAKEDLDAVLAFLGTLDFTPPASERTESAARGAAVFKAKACDACHAPPDYTSGEPYLVGLESPSDAYKGYNPPPLRGVATRGPYLHDAGSRTLEDVLQKRHRPSKLTGKPDLTAQELADLIAFLKSL